MKYLTKPTLPVKATLNTSSLAILIHIAWDFNLGLEQANNKPSAGRVH